MLDEATLRRLYLDERRTIREIAATVSLSAAQVNRALCHWNIPRRRRGPRREVVDTPTRATLSAHVTILGVQRTAQHLGIPSRHILALLGIRPLPRGSKPKIVSDAAVWQAYQAEETGGIRAVERVASLAKQLGCSPRTVWRSLARVRAQRTRFQGSDTSVVG